MVRASLFSLISDLQSSLPLSKEKVEHAFGTTLKEVGGNEYFVFLEGVGKELTDGVEVGGIDLRLSRLDAEKSILVFRVTGRCMRLEALQAHYGELEIVGVPRGRSNDEETAFGIVNRGVRLGFGFKESRPECLSSVVMEPL